MIYGIHLIISFRFPLHKKRLKERGYNQSEPYSKRSCGVFKNTYAYRFAYPHKSNKNKVHLYERNVLQMFRVHSNAQKNVTVRKYCFLTIFTPQETPLSLVQENWRITVAEQICAFDACNSRSNKITYNCVLKQNIR